jgi:hypothetical protein
MYELIYPRISTYKVYNPNTNPVRSVRRVLIHEVLYY